MAEPQLEWRADPGDLDLRVATSVGEVRAAAEGLGTSVAALAQALLSALDGRGGLEDRGRAARRRVEDAFSVRAISRQLAAALVTTAT